jgi:hypothetical protein
MSKSNKASQLRLCIDRIIPADLKRDAARFAIAENARNDPRHGLETSKRAGVSLHPAKMALLTGKLWSKGRVLRVGFLDGSSTQRKRVMKHAEEWLSYANVRFDWKGGKKAEIRVSFSFDPGSWSAVGTDCLHTEYFKKNEPTINFGWLKDDTDDEEYNRVVVHEFGHALGCIHEHQNPKGGIVWNTAAVYAAFSGPPNNWSRDEIDSNVIEKYSIDQLNATKFDGKSIMLYAFPKQLIKGPPSLAKAGTRTNTDLSSGDKRFIAKNYPK